MQFLDIFGLKRLKNWINNKFYTKTEIDNKIPNLENYATKSDVSDAIENLIGAAPEALDTLGEIADALSNGEAVESALTNQIAAKYTKPSTGIPATDLTSDVQSALNKANSAIQNETDPIFSASAASTIQSTDIENWNSKTSNTGTITGITMNGTSKGTSGVVDLGTVLTEHQDISGKANTSDIKNATLTLRANNTNYATTFSANAATDTTIDLGYMVHTVGTGSDIQSGNIKLKTINNNSILGEGNVDTSEIVYVEYNTTPYADVAAAVNAGKQVICLMNGGSLPLIADNDGTYFFSTSVIMKTPETELETGRTIGEIIGVSIDSTNGWSDPLSIFLPDLTNVEFTTNKVTSLSESSTDTQYPSAKAVYDMITDDEQVIGAALNNLNARIDTNQYERIDYQDLCYLRNNSKLIPGKQYCITNYYATTTDPESRAQDHPFNIIVTALTENKLSEEARACPGGGSYYANNNLAAWKVWYCLDNDTTRFAWADTNGHGVIYRLIDEFGNDAPYDFKNIQFKRYKVTAKTEYADYLSKYNGLYVGLSGTQTKGFDIDTSDYKWFYTFSSLGSDWTTDATDASITGTGAGNNTFKTTESINRVVPFLNNVVIMCGEVALDYIDDTTTPASVAQNSHFEENCSNVTIFGGVWNNFCQSQFRQNVIIGEFRHNTIETDCQDNLIIGKDICFNTFGTYFNGNIFVSTDQYINHNNIGSGFENNVIFTTNSFLANQINSKFKNNVIKVTDTVQGNEINVQCNDNQFVAIRITQNVILPYFHNNVFNVSGNIIYRNRFGVCMHHNTFNGRIIGNTFMGQNNTFGSEIAYSTMDGAFDYITIPDGSTSSIFAFNDIKGPIRGTSSAPIVLDNSAFRVPSLIGVKRRINIEGDPNGNVIATWKDGETIQGVKKASGASTWTTFTIQSGVIPEAATTTPLMDGTAAVGTSTKYAKEDHVHPSDTSKANVQDPTVNGKLTVNSGVEESSTGLDLQVLQIDPSNGAVSMKDLVGSSYATTELTFPAPVSGTRTIALPASSGTLALAATTLAGYGITDAYTKTETDTAILNAKEIFIVDADTATFTEIRAAYNAGKIVYLNKNGQLFSVNNAIAGGGAGFVFTRVYPKQTDPSVLCLTYIYLFTDNRLDGPFTVEYASINSPTFTGTPSAPTASVGTNTTQIATTAFVQNTISSVSVPTAATSNPLMDGTAAVGSSTKYAKEDHVHPTDTSRAPINSPVFNTSISIADSQQQPIMLIDVDEDNGCPEIFTSKGTLRFNATSLGDSLAVITKSGTIAMTSDIPVFIATYGTTSYADIEAAINSGKVVVVKNEDMFYLLSGSTSTTYIFSTFDSVGTVISSVTVENDNTWWGNDIEVAQQESVENALDNKADKSTTLSGYGITNAYTKTEVDTALAGKQGTISDLATIRSGAAAGATAYQKPSTGIPASDLATGVIPDTSAFEVASNKVTSLSSSSTDTQYPSAKCVYDMIGDIESVLDQIIQPTNS